MIVGKGVTHIQDQHKWSDVTTFYYEAGGQDATFQHPDFKMH